MVAISCRGASSPQAAPSPASAAPASGTTASSTHSCPSGSPNMTAPAAAVTSAPGRVNEANAAAAPSTTEAAGTGSVA